MEQPYRCASPPFLGEWTTGIKRVLQGIKLMLELISIQVKEGDIPYDTLICNLNGG